MLQKLIRKLRGKPDPTITSSIPEPEPEPEPYTLSLITHHASKQPIKSVGTRDLQIALDECELWSKYNPDDDSVRPLQEGDLIIVTDFAPRIRRELYRREVI